MPKTRAVPREGVWNPSRVLIKVDLPAPLGPSRPMALPRSSPVRLSRTTRPPSFTSRRSRSMTPMLLPYEFMTGFVPVEQRAEGEKIEPEKAAVAGHFNAALVAVCADRGRPGVGRQLADGVRRLAAELLQQRAQHRAQVLVSDRRVVLVLVLGQQGPERRRPAQRSAAGVGLQRIH